MKNTPLISVIVPVYKVEKYLAECLDSICRQTYKNIEVICVNDGSPDNCAEILQNYAACDSRITVITQQNQGLSAARNAGFAAATGEYITFVDSDDFISLIMIEELYKKAKQTNADIVVGDLEKFYQKGGKPEHINYWRRLDNDGVVREEKQMPRVFRAADIYNYTFTSPCYACCKLYLRSFLQEHNISFVTGIIYEDIIYFLDIIAANPLMSFIDKPFYKYRVQPESTCNKISPKQLDILRVYEILRHKIKQYHLEKQLGQNLYHMMKYNLVWSYFVIPDDCKKQYVKRVKKFLNRKDYNHFLSRTQNVKIIDCRLFRIKLPKKKK